MTALALLLSASLGGLGQDASAQSPAVITPAVLTPATTHGDGIEVTIASVDAVTLAGTFVVPAVVPQGAAQAAPARIPAVVFITGSGLQDRDETILGHKPFRLLAAALAEQGIASVRCDDRGFGASTGNPSSATTFDFLKDAKAQVAWLRARPEIDPTRVGVIGHSEGGLIGTLMAQGPDPAVNFAVLLAPPGILGAEVIVTQSQAMYSRMGGSTGDVAYVIECLRELLDAALNGSDDATLKPIMRRLVEAQFVLVLKSKPSEEMIDATVQDGIKKFGSPWMRTFLSLDPAPAIAEISVPTLVLFGERDLQVVPKFNRKAFVDGSKVSPSKPEIVVVESANHLFQRAKSGLQDEYATIKETMDPSVPALIVKWIVRTTNAQQPLPAVSPKSSP